MSRTVSIREVKKVKKSEISKFEGLTTREIVRDYKNIISLFEVEYLSEAYSSMRKYMTRITTADGEIMYIAHTKILVICSDSLLATEVDGRIRNYVACSHRDITKLAGETLFASEVIFGEDDEDYKEREINFKLPEKERGVHIFFFDDMD